MINLFKKKSPVQFDHIKGIKLNIGGGKGHPQNEEWKILDLRESADIKIDITKEALPFADNSVSIVFTSHTLEHIYPHDLEFVLKEFYRVIKPETEQGLVRISVPDINKACQAYMEGNKKFFDEAQITYYDDEAPIGGLFSNWFYSISSVGNGHVHCFDFEYMAYWLKKCGFRKVVPSGYKKSCAKELRSDEFDLRPNESLFVEAFK